MVTVPGPIRAVSFDFFNTLVFHRDGRGRGRQLAEYLERNGFEPGPWEYDVLYGVYELHDSDYRPEAPDHVRSAYYEALARRAFHGWGRQRSACSPR